MKDMLCLTEVNDDGELEYVLDENGDKIEICGIDDVEFEEVEGYKSSKYFTIKNGQRLTRKDIKIEKQDIENPIEIYSASEFNEDVFGYIDEEELLKIKPNQNIYKGKTLLLNTGGSVGAIRFKNNNYKYSVIDNVIVYEDIKDISFLEYLHFCLIQTMDNSNFNYSNTLRGDGIKKANIIFKIPLPTKTHTSLQLQKAIAKKIEDFNTRVDEQVGMLKKMMNLNVFLKEKTVEDVFEKTERLDGNKDMLYLTEVNDDGELKYVLDENGDKIEICGIDDVEFEEVEFDEKIKIIKGMSKYTKEYVQKESGLFPVFSSDTNIKTYGTMGYINTYDHNRRSIQYTSNGEKAGTIFKIPKMKFSMNGDRGMFDFDSEEINDSYLFFILKQEFVKHSFNWGNKPSNEKIKNKIKIPIPLPTKTHTSLQLQKAIAKKIEDKHKNIDLQNKKIEKMIDLLEVSKEKKVEEIIHG